MTLQRIDKCDLQRALRKARAISARGRHEEQDDRPRPAHLTGLPGVYKRRPFHHAQSVEEIPGASAGVMRKNGSRILPDII